MIYLLCPIINAGFNKQAAEGIELLQRSKISNDGCWNSFMFVDERTEAFHRENDCAYTIITVPK